MLASARPYAFLCAALVLGACVPQGDAPSLAVRPAELDRTTAAPERPPVAVSDDPALGRLVAGLQRQAEEGDRAFDAAYGPTEAMIARAGAAASESWVEAQLALSRLEGERGATTRALSELDRLAVERADVPTSEADQAAIQSGIATVERIAAAQQVRIDRLRARLPNL